MKKVSLLRALVVLALVFGATALGLAQSAVLTAETKALAAGGGTVTLAATANYEGQPGALGWSIALPADWFLVSVSGPNPPGIAPEAGSAGTLEFAYFAIPANRAEFKFVVRYPPGAATAKATPTVLIRANGKLVTLEPAAMAFGGN